ncbi:MAG: glycosyltransferase family 2 protein [archaeon]|nr:glycosyltransferase family 2 protein [archaeon]
MKEKLVSINIPTYNSKKTIRKTLESLKNQTYKNIEIIVVDSNSTDGTLNIIKEFKEIKVYQYEGTLLGARELGARKSKGKFIALVDSDHILEKRTIERAVKLMNKFDMLFFYERSYKPKKLLEFLYDADRRLTQNYLSDYVEPVGGTVLPRFYKREILLKAFKSIPKKILSLCVAHDHAIIYYEARKLSKRVEMLGDENNPAIWHQEPWSWRNLFKKTYRYGVTTRKLIENKVYPQILKSKNKGRKIKFGSLGLSIKSNILRLVREIPYFYGYLTGKNKQIPGL